VRISVAILSLALLGCQPKPDYVFGPAGTPVLIVQPITAPAGSLAYPTSRDSYTVIETPTQIPAGAYIVAKEGSTRPLIQP